MQEPQTHSTADEPAGLAGADVATMALRDRHRSEASRLGAVLRNAAAGVTAQTGEQFFRSLVRYLARTLEFRFAFVGRIERGSHDVVNTLEVWAGGARVENFRYELTGTPCENVVASGMCCYPRDVQRLFPEDALLRKMGVESYVGTALFDTTGQPIGIIVVLDDRPIEEEDLVRATLQIFASRAAAELERGDVLEALRGERDFADKVLDTVGALVTVFDVGGRIVRFNAACEGCTGYEAEEVVGKLFWDVLIAPEDLVALRARFACIAAGEQPAPRETAWLTRSGERRQISWTCGLLTDERGAVRYVIATGIDVTEARRLSRELDYQASHDALTGLANRPEFERRLEFALNEARESGKPHALCYVDLDQFKLINDVCGHVAGDEMLRQLGRRLRSRIRSQDTLARLGGDEFGVLIERCTVDRAERVAYALRGAVEEFRFIWEERTFGLSASIGLVPITADSESATSILRLADTACFAAKDAGRNRVHVHGAGDVEVERRHGEMQWVSVIQEAIEKDRFRIYRQDIAPVRLDRDAGEHFELLLRLENPEGQLVMPGAFLPAAERYNLGARVDRWVVDAALRWLSAHPQALDRLFLCAINLSGQSLSTEELLDYVERRLDETGVPPDKLCFEITETAAITHLPGATRFLRALGRRGCSFALDDFGSGLSSFGYLKTLPVDFLKIDGLFVKDIADDPVDRTMVRSIHEVAQVMGKRTVAEFVESDEILHHLREIGVDYAQGYGIARPRPL